MPRVLVTEKLAERNRVLEAEVRDLKNGLEAVEDLRRDLQQALEHAFPAG